MLELITPKGAAAISDEEAEMAGISPGTMVEKPRERRGLWHIGLSVKDGSISVYRARKYITSPYTFKTKKEALRWVEYMGEAEAKRTLFGLGPGGHKRRERRKR